MSSVTFPVAIGGDGSTVTDDDNATTGLRNGGWRTRFIPCFTNLVDICDYTVSYAAQAATFAEPPPMGSTTPNTGAFTRITVTGSTAPANGLYLPAANSLGFATNSTERVRIDASGNVGIGTSSPGAKFVVKTSNGYQCWTDNLSTTGIRLVGVNAAGSDYAPLYMAGSELGFTIGATERMRLDSSGNLGLGVTPSAWTTYKALQIGGAGFMGTSSDLNASANAYYNAGWKYYGTGLATLYNQSAGVHSWYNAPSGTAGNAISFTQAMTLDASGNLLVGTTTNPSYGKVVIDAGTLEPLNLVNTSGATRYPVVFINGTTIVGTISTSTTNTAYNTSSDQRLKTNITPAGSAIQSILDFPVDQFDWISTGEHQDFGAVAQKAINVIPEMVSVSADEDEMWGIDWSKAVPRLIKTIQEMHEEIQTLKQRIN